MLDQDSGNDTTFVWNWDGKLRSASVDNNSISLKYDPMGNRVYKDSTINGTRKYIIDISGELPTILLAIDPCDSSLKKKYIYANSQILAQHDVPDNNELYFYLHDRLGSVRLVIDDAGTAKNSYTYNAFGESFDTETAENVSNPFKFTGQFFDDEIGQYYLRARQYDPALMRFTSRDPVRGKFKKPLTLHRYLYCNNDSINRVDPSGEFLLDLLFGPIAAANMRVKIAGACFAANVIAVHLVNTLNMRATMMAIQLQNFSLESVGVLSTKFNNISLMVQAGGIRAITALSQFVANYTNLQTYDEQMRFIYSSLGADPDLPSTYAQEIGFLVNIVGTELYEDLSGQEQDGPYNVKEGL